MVNSFHCSEGNYFLVWNFNKELRFFLPVFYLIQLQISILSTLIDWFAWNSVRTAGLWRPPYLASISHTVINNINKIDLRTTTQAPNGGEEILYKGKVVLVPKPHAMKS